MNNDKNKATTPTTDTKTAKRNEISIADKPAVEIRKPVDLDAVVESGCSCASSDDNPY